MFREIAGFLIILVIVRFALPQEISNLITQILLQVLTLVRDVVSQAPAF